MKQISKVEKQDLLILDDFGLKALDHINRQVLMEIIEDRHGKHSTIIASQFPVEVWHEVIGEQTIADAKTLHLHCSLSSVFKWFAIPGLSNVCIGG